jgi:hypothetical protein
MPATSAPEVQAPLLAGYAIPMYRDLARALGSVIAALVLQQFHYWALRAKNVYEGERWVFKTYKELSNELGITPDQARGAVNILKGHGLLRSMRNPRKGWDQIRWYRPDYEALNTFMADCLADLPDEMATTPDDLASAPDQMVTSPEEMASAPAQYQKITNREDKQENTPNAAERGQDDDDAQLLLCLYVKALAKHGIGKPEYIEADMAKRDWQSEFCAGVVRYGAEVIEQAILRLLDYLDNPSEFAETADWSTVLRGPQSARAFIRRIPEIQAMLREADVRYDQW